LTRERCQAKIKEVKQINQLRINQMSKYIEDQTPQSLCIEIQKHETILTMVANGLTKMTKYKQKKHLEYISALNKQLMNITAVDYEDLSDADLLASLGL
jgi:hypothetical protein